MKYKINEFVRVQGLHGIYYGVIKEFHNDSYYIENVETKHLHIRVDEDSISKFDFAVFNEDIQKIQQDAINRIANLNLAYINHKTN